MELTYLAFFPVLASTFENLKDTFQQFLKTFIICIQHLKTRSHDHSGKSSDSKWTHISRPFNTLAVSAASYVVSLVVNRLSS